VPGSGCHHTGSRGQGAGGRGQGAGAVEATDPLTPRDVAAPRRSRQCSASSMDQRVERRILHETEVHAELSCPAPLLGQPAAVASAPGRLQRLFAWGPVLRRVGYVLGYISAPPAVSTFFASRPNYALAASTDGAHAAILTCAGLVVRARADNYEGNDAAVPAWIIPSAERGHRRWHVAWASAAPLLAVHGAATGTVHVLDMQGRKRCSRATPPHVAGFVLIYRDEMASVLCVTLGGQLHWLSAERGDDGAALPPAIANVLPTGQNSCVCAVCYSACSGILFVGGSCGGTPSLTTWLVDNGRRSVTHVPIDYITPVALPAPTPVAGVDAEPSGGAPANTAHACCRLQLAPSGQAVAAVDSGGRVIVWDVSGRSAPAALTAASDIVDIGWWGDEALALLQRNGSLTVRGLSGDEENLLRDKELEVFNPSSMICSVANSAEQTRRVLILEGPDPSAMQQDAVLSVCSLRQVTPEESMATNLKHHEYGEAYSIAQYYGIDTDRVYKQQWLDLPVTADNNSNLLSKVKDHSWIFEQCVNRVVNTGREARCLLDYGLYLAHVPRLQKWVTRMAARTKASSTEGDPPELNEQECAACAQRDRLVRYRQRLSTHIEIQRGYNRHIFLRFRDADMLEEALQHATRGNIDAVILLLTYHGYRELGGLLAYRLTILNRIAETVPPKRYFDLLPAIHKGELAPVAQKRWIEGDDYVQSQPARQLWGASGDSSTISQVSPDDMSPAALSAWYLQRARALDENAGQIYASLELLHAGMKNGIVGLEALAQTFTELVDIIQRGTASFDTSVTMYEAMSPERRLTCFIGDCDESNIVQAILDKAKGLLQTEQTLLENFLRSKADDEFELVEAVFTYNAREETKGTLINNRIFSCETALILTALECVYSCSRVDAWPLLGNTFESLPVRDRGRKEPDYMQAHKMLDELDEHLTAGVDILKYYGIANTVAFYANDDILSTLALLRSGNWTESNMRMSANMRNDFVFDELPASVELLILGNSCLCNSAGIGAIRSVCCRWRERGNRIFSVHQLVRSIPRATAAKTTQPNDLLGLRLIQDTQFLCRIFTFLPYNDALLYCFEGLLVQGYFETARQLIDGTLPQRDGLMPVHIMYGDSGKLRAMALRIGRMALSAARELVNGSADSCSAARQCLQVVEPLRCYFAKNFLREIDDELQFADGISELFRHDLSTFVVPLKVRQCTNKLDVVQDLLHATELYLEVDAVVSTFCKLGLGSETDRLRVRAAVAQFAFESDDICIACEQCLSLIKSEYPDVWSLSHTIGKLWIADSNERGTPAGFTTSRDAQELLAFAVKHCPPAALPTVLCDWRQCETIASKSKDSLMSQKAAQKAAEVANQMSDLGRHLMSDLGGRFGKQLGTRFGMPSDTSKGLHRYEAPVERRVCVAHPFYAECTADAVAAKHLSAAELVLPEMTVEHVASWLATHTHDLPLCVSVLLDIPQPETIDEILQCVCQHDGRCPADNGWDSSLQCTVGMCCFSLLLLGHIQGPVGVATALTWNLDALTKEMIPLARAAMEDTGTVSDDTNKMIRDTQYCAERVIYFSDIAGDAELQHVLDITDVDCEQFKSNAAYRDTELSRLIDSERIVECGRLLHFLNLPAWHLHVSQLCKNLLSDLQASEAWLKDRDSLLSRPDELEHVLRDRILCAVSHTQHDRLAMSFELLRECCKRTRGRSAAYTQMTQHCASICALLGTPPSFRDNVNYYELAGTMGVITDSQAKKVVSSRHDAIQMLKGVLSDDNVVPTARALDGLFVLANDEHITSSLVYRSFIENKLDISSCTELEWLNLLPQLEQCDTLDVAQICQKYASLESVPMKLCDRMLADSVRIAEQRFARQKQLSEADPRVAESRHIVNQLNLQEHYLRGLIQVDNDAAELIKEIRISTSTVDRCCMGGSWTALLQKSLDPGAIRQVLVRMAALGCPEIILEKVTASFLVLHTNADVTTIEHMAVEKEVQQLFADAVRTTLEAFKACSHDEQYSAVAEFCFQNFYIAQTDVGAASESCTAAQMMPAKVQKSYDGDWTSRNKAAIVDLSSDSAAKMERFVVRLKDWYTERVNLYDSDPAERANMQAKYGDRAGYIQSLLLVVDQKTAAARKKAQATDAAQPEFQSVRSVSSTKFSDNAVYTWPPVGAKSSLDWLVGYTCGAHVGPGTSDAMRAELVSHCRNGALQDPFDEQIASRPKTAAALLALGTLHINSGSPGPYLPERSALLFFVILTVMVASLQLDLAVDIATAESIRQVCTGEITAKILLDHIWKARTSSTNRFDADHLLKVSCTARI
jgi:hypothetical protein